MDKDLDVEAQMKYDPTGTLTLFWEEQRRMLNRNHKQTRWHPKVLNYCFFLWIRMGNKRFKKLREILILPNLRTLQRIKSKCPMGSGITPESLEQLHKLWLPNVKCYTDWDCMVLWDATGKEKDVTRPETRV